MKKLEASLIKKVLRIKGKTWSIQFWIYHYSLSLFHTLEHLVYSWSTLVECGILGDLDQENKGKAGKWKMASGSTLV